jgi:NADH:ubiquinone oxidoreductase subunit K
VTCGLSVYLTVGAGLVALALLALMIRRDLRGALLAIELILAAAVINLTAAGRFLDDLTGAVVALLVLAFGAAQVVVLTAMARGAKSSDDPGGPA